MATYLLTYIFLPGQTSTYVLVPSSQHLLSLDTNLHRRQSFTYNPHPAMPRVVELKDKLFMVLKASRPMSIFCCILVLGNGMMHSPAIQSGPLVLLHLVRLTLHFPSLFPSVRVPIILPCYRIDIEYIF